MLYAGEDVKFIARRIIICAAEDVGNADPNALTVAVSAAQRWSGSVCRGPDPPGPGGGLCGDGSQEQRACLGIFKAMEAVRSEKTPPVPAHLQDKHYKGAEKLGLAWDISTPTIIPDIM